jgi:hypothetical protein
LVVSDPIGDGADAFHLDLVPSATIRSLVDQVVAYGRVDWDPLEQLIVARMRLDRQLAELRMLIRSTDAASHELRRQWVAIHDAAAKHYLRDLGPGALAAWEELAESVGRCLSAAEQLAGFDAETTALRSVLRPGNENHAELVAAIADAHGAIAALHLDGGTP